MGRKGDLAKWLGFTAFLKAHSYCGSTQADDIDNDWPTALMGPDFKYLPGDEPHWIAIRGYEYPYPGYEHEHAIMCTDSATCTSYLHLDWDNLSIPFPPVETVLIMD